MKDTAKRTQKFIADGTEVSRKEYEGLLASGKFCILRTEEIESSECTDGRSPIPWKIAISQHDAERFLIESAFIDGAGTHIVGELDKREESRANAAFIVRAVNSHEDLLKGLKRAVALGTFPKEFTDEMKKLIAKAEASSEGGK